MKMITRFLGILLSMCLLMGVTVFAAETRVVIRSNETVTFSASGEVVAPTEETEDAEELEPAETDEEDADVDTEEPADVDAEEPADAEEAEDETDEEEGQAIDAEAVLAAATAAVSEAGAYKMSGTLSTTIDMDFFGETGSVTAPMTIDAVCNSEDNIYVKVTVEDIVSEVYLENATSMFMKNSVMDEWVAVDLVDNSALLGNIDDANISSYVATETEKDGVAYTVITQTVDEDEFSSLIQSMITDMDLMSFVTSVDETITEEDMALVVELVNEMLNGIVVEMSADYYINNETNLYDFCDLDLVMTLNFNVPELELDASVAITMNGSISFTDYGVENEMPEIA